MGLRPHFVFFHLPAAGFDKSIQNRTHLLKRYCYDYTPELLPLLRTKGEPGQLEPLEPRWRINKNPHLLYDQIIIDPKTGKAKCHQKTIKANIIYIKDLQQRREAAKVLMADNLYNPQTLSYNSMTGEMDKPND
jgi:hypothetical protein